MFKMPKVDLGNLVLVGFSRRDPEASVAIVTRVFDNCVNLRVFADDSYDTPPRSAVHHADDPAVRSDSGQEVWWHRSEAPPADAGKVADTVEMGVKKKGA